MVVHTTLRILQTRILTTHPHLTEVTQTSQLFPKSSVNYAERIEAQDWENQMEVPKGLKTTTWIP